MLYLLPVGPAQGLGLRPHPKNIPRKKALLSIIKSPNFYKLYIYIYIFILKVVFYLFITSNVKDTTNFTIDLQIAMLLITKK